MPSAALIAFTAAALAAPVGAIVCDGKSPRAPPCFPLAGGRKLPQVAMGTWAGSYGDCGKSDYTCGQQHARFAVESWLQIGGTHIDGANDYRTQVSIAEAIRNTPNFLREEVFITTKCPGPMGYEALIQCADDNLQMLGQFTSQGPGYIDLLLIHFPFTIKPACRFSKTLPECKVPYTPASKEALQDTWRAMEELKRIGVVKSIGVSDYNITHLQQTLEIAKEPIEVNQVEWNPKNHDDTLLAFSRQHGILLQAWSPLGGSAGSVLGEPALKKIAAAHGVSMPQVVLRWALQQGVAVVVGTANPAHAADDLASTKLVLTEEEMRTISALQPHPQAPEVVV